MPSRKFTGMRNRDAARYARWSAAAAVAVCLLVLGVYFQRRTREEARNKNLPPVPATVAQQSANFVISRAIGPRTLFTVHASQATQFKDENRSLLENVQITIYGQKGDRNDSVRAGECSYEPNTGSIRCQGVVQIDLRDAKSGAQKSQLHLETSNILFEHDSGKVSTENSVALKFPGGQGRGIGLVYEPESENVTLEKDVQLDIAPPRQSHVVPVHVTSSALEFRRGDNALRLFGPVRVQQESRTLAAGAVELQLNAAMQPVRAVATGSPQIAASSARGTASFASDQITADLSPDGAIEKISADQNVRGESTGRGSVNHLSAQHAELLMSENGGQNLVREVHARGSVRVEMRRGEREKNITTQSLRLYLSPRTHGGGENVASAETLSPGELVMIEPGESERLQGGKLSAIFGAQNQLTELRGGSGVRMERRLGAKPLETSTAQTLLATFGPDGNWQTVDESGQVKFSEGNRSGAANTAQLVRTTNEIRLAGSAYVQDSASHLQAAKIQLNQTTNEMHANGNVVASFAEQNGNSAASGAPGSAQISADEMSGGSPQQSRGATVSSAGHAVFSGHARLWQGSDALQAQTIEFWQNEKRAEARGDAVGAFVEAPHNGAADAKKAGKKSAPVFWQVHAPKVDYWSDSGKMEWSDGVQARSSEGAITSQTLEMSFSKDANHQQTLERAIASGRVRIEENGRTGTAERGEYIARDGKFTLSGGQPTLADGSGNTTTGRELTFFLASDTILVDSQNESRSIVKHRAEK